MTKCRNRSRVALSSIFHPSESPKTQSSLSQGSEVLWAGGEAEGHLCVLSPSAHLSAQRDWECASVVVVLPRAEMSGCDSLLHGGQFLGAV